MKLLFFLVTTVIFFHANLNAQKIVSTTPEDKWTLAGVMENFDRVNDIMHFELATRQKSVIFLDKENAVMPIELPGGFAIIKMDHSANIIWKQMVKGFILSVCKKDDKILAFYTNEWNGNTRNEGPIKTIHVTSFDPGSGQQLADKIIFENTKGLYVDVKVNRTPDGELQSLLIKYNPKEPRRGASKPVTAIDLVIISSDLTAQVHPLNSVAVNNYFFGCIATSTDELYVFSMMPGATINIESFDTKSSTAGNKMSVAQDISYESIIRTTGDFALDQQDRIYFAMRCHGNKHKDLFFKIFSVDIKTKKVIVHEDLHDKDYAKILEDQNPDSKVKLRHDIDGLELAGLYIIQDKVFLLKQLEFENFYGSGAIRQHFNDVVVSVFDRDLKNITNLVVNKELELFIGIGSGVGFHTIDDKLALVYNVTSGIASVSPSLSMINLKTLKIEKNESSEKYPLGNNMCEPQAIIWFPDGPIIPCYTHNGTYTSLKKIVF